MAVKIITCPWCGKEVRITYEEDRVYQMKCYECKNTMLHVDHSFDSAAEFFEHNADLLQAEQDGRLVVLPCKVGDTVYVIGESCDFCETYLDEPERCMRCEKGHYVEERGFELWMLSELNESIFLTREAAEAELKGGAK